MSTQLATSMEIIRKSLRKAAEDVLHINSKNAISNEVDSEEFKETLMKDAMKLMELETEGAQMQHIFEALHNDLKDGSDEVPNEKALEELYEKAKKTHKNVKGERQYFKDIIKSIRDESKNDENEMEVMQVQHSRKDPISKKDIVNPVISKNCGHVYDRDSIHEFAGKKRVIKCAMQGCSETINIGQLADYPDYWTNIKQQQ